MAQFNQRRPEKFFIFWEQGQESTLEVVISDNLMRNTSPAPNMVQSTASMSKARGYQ